LEALLDEVNNISLENEEGKDGGVEDGLLCDDITENLLLPKKLDVLSGSFWKDTNGFFPEVKNLGLS